MQTRLAVLLLLLLAASARASLTFSLLPLPQVVERGTELVFSGTLSNTSTTDRLYLNDIQAALTGDSAIYLTLKPRAFFANVPGILLPGESYSGVIVRLAVSRLTPAGSYSGTLILRGGADRLALTDLASASFGAASPLVAVVAVDPVAAEFGPDGGLFTFSRTGSTAAALTVPYSTSGPAVNGVAYSAISSPATIPAGAHSASLALAPIPDAIAQGDRAATLDLVAGSYTVAANGSATVTIFDKPIDEWRALNFGLAANDPPAADTADGEQDGVLNMVEYALDLQPLTPDRPALTVPYVSADYLSLTYVPNPLAIDLAYSVEASNDLVIWGVGNVEEVIVTNPDPITRRTFRYKFPLSVSNRAYLRLRVTR